MVKPDYRRLFYSTESGVEYFRAAFDEAETDEVKMLVFVNNQVKWESIKDEVREFTHANWNRWKAEQPAWFTDGFVQRVPDEFIPVAELAALNASASGGKRRRSVSVVESVRESARRESARRGSLQE
jgi:hypothetical protein